MSEWLIALITSTFVSLGMTILYDRKSTFFNRKEYVQGVEENAPKMFAAQRAELEKCGNIIVYTMKIKSEVKNENGVCIEKWGTLFEKHPSLISVAAEFAHGFYLKNHTNDGISFRVLHSNAKIIIDISNWTDRNIHPGGEVVLLYENKDRPEKMIAHYGEHELEYTISLDSRFITPKCTKYKNLNKKIKLV